MKKTLKSGNLELVVDSEGAYIDALKYNGIDILFAKRYILENGQEKVRGGSHPCFPHFGPAVKVNLPQHGFARNKNWKIINARENEIILKLENAHEDWKNVVATIVYTINSNEFETKLLVENNSDEAIYVTPGFHPYFAYADGNDIKLNGEKFELKEDLVDSYFIDEVRSFETTNYKINFETQNLNKFVLWTSFSGKFLCVEPSFNFKALEDDKELAKIESGKSMEFNYKIYIEIK